MSTNRFKPDAGWVWGSKDRGPNGRGICRQCKVEVPTGRRTFCSAKCVHEWKLRTDPQYVRHRLYDRDHGVCAICGLDTRKLVMKIEKEWDRLQKRLNSTQSEGDLIHDWAWRLSHGHDPSLAKILKRYRIPSHRWCASRSRGIWDADHITPVVEGGGECGLDGYRTLCLKCHREETNELAGRRAKKRKEPVEVPGSVPCSRPGRWTLRSACLTAASPVVLAYLGLT